MEKTSSTLPKGNHAPKRTTAVPGQPVSNGASKTVTKSEDDAIVIDAPIVVRDLAEKLEVRVTDLISELIKAGVMASINDRVDLSTAQMVAEKFSKVVAGTKSSKGKSKAKSKAGGDTRPPVVAVLGHVDHGKTSLLDKIRSTGVAATEAGGITQHLRAHQVTWQGHQITFLDTPGHAAFSILREHGAHLTDIALIVVAADDGIKPQTEEVIKFAQSAGVKIVVALTKTDKPGIDLNRIKQQLADKGLNPEEWGGDTVVVETSATSGKGIDKLLEMIMLVAEVEELTARSQGPAEGTVIETHITKGQGTASTLLVEEGRLKGGDFVVAGQVYGKARRIEDVAGKPVQDAGPSTPVVVTGWKDMPPLGVRFKVVESESEAKRLAQAEDIAAGTVDTQSDLKSRATAPSVGTATTKQLLFVVKADVHGSLEALLKSLEAVSLEGVKAKVVSQGLGDINESDVSLAQSVGASVLGFNVEVPVQIKQQAQRSKVTIKIYKVIYELLDDVTAQLESLVEPTFNEEKVAGLEVKGVFKVTKNNLICGGLVAEGKIGAGLAVKKVDGEDVIEIGKVQSVQKDQNDVKEVTEGQMCGLNIATASKAAVAIDDHLEFFKLIQVITKK